MLNHIDDFLSKYNLDVRKTGDARFMDQKCTPDVVCFIADCIINTAQPDQWSNGPATHVHHIFPKSDFPQLAHYVENLILLTATQHNTKAHPNNNTHVIDKEYQLVLLLAKSDTIEKSINKFGDRYYRKESFVYVINNGLSVDWSSSTSFDDLRQLLIRQYNR